MSAAAADSVNPSASSANDLQALKRKVDGHENASIADSSFLGSDAVVSDCGYAMRKFLLEAETVYDGASNVGSAAKPKHEHLEVRHEDLGRVRLPRSFDQSAQQPIFDVSCSLLLFRHRFESQFASLIF